MTKKLAVLMLVTMSGCMAVVQGNGSRKTETRDVAEFNQVVIGHGFQAVATLGSPASLTIEADENILPHVVATVSNGMLVVDAPDGTLLMAASPVKVTLVSPTLLAASAEGEAQLTAVASPGETFTVHASGSSRVDVSGIAVTTLNADASGMSRLTLAGTADEAKLHLSGASTAFSTSLSAAAVRLDGSGGSSATVRASSEVTGGLSGGSHVTIMGRPSKVQVDVSGGSSVQMGE